MHPDKPLVESNNLLLSASKLLHIRHFWSDACTMVNLAVCCTLECDMDGAMQSVGQSLDEYGRTCSSSVSAYVSFIVDFFLLC